MHAQERNVTTKLPGYWQKRYDLVVVVQLKVKYGDLAGTAAAADRSIEAGLRHIVLDLRTYPDQIATRIAEEIILPPRAGD